MKTVSKRSGQDTALNAICPPPRRVIRGNQTPRRPGAMPTMHKNQVVGFMLIALILRLAWALLSAPIGLAQDDPFLPLSDFMADCLKISLSFKVSTAPLLADPRI